MLNLTSKNFCDIQSHHKGSAFVLIYQTFWQENQFFFFGNFTNFMSLSVFTIIAILCII